MAVDMAQHDIVVQAHRIRYEPKQHSYRWIAKADLQLLTQLDEPCSQWDVGSKLKAVNILVRARHCGTEICTAKCDPFELRLHRLKDIL